MVPALRGQSPGSGRGLLSPFLSRTTPKTRVGLKNYLKLAAELTFIISRWPQRISFELKPSETATSSRLRGDQTEATQ